MMNAIDKNKKIAESYYKAMGRKNVAEIEPHIHSEIEFIAPLAQTKGKEAFLEAAKRFTTLFNSLTIDASFGSGDQAVIVYNLECAAPIGSLRTMALISIQDDLISRIELFYDPRPFVK